MQRRDSFTFDSFAFGLTSAGAATIAVTVEAEEGDVIRAVDQLDNQLAAGASPGFVGLPDVAVALRAGVILQAAAAGGDGLLNRVAAAAAAAATIDVLRSGVARGEDIQPKVATQAKLDRNRLAGIDRVDGRQVVHRLEEARPVVGYVIGGSDAAGVAGVVGCTTTGGGKVAGAVAIAAAEAEGGLSRPYRKAHPLCCTPPWGQRQLHRRRRCSRQ